MAKKIIWTSRAQRERKQILEFWIDNNHNNKYSLKLDSFIREAIQLIKRHPQIGRPTDIEGVRVKIIRDYLMFYEITDSNIYILTIWDNRQNPEDLIF